MSELSVKKVKLEKNVLDLIKEKETKQKEVDGLAVTINELSEGVKKEKELCRKYLDKQDESLSSIMNIEKREENLAKKEELVAKSEIELEKKQHELSIEANIIKEKTESLKRIWERTH